MFGSIPPAKPTNGCANAFSLVLFCRELSGDCCTKSFMVPASHSAGSGIRLFPIFDILVFALQVLLNQSYRIKQDDVNLKAVSKLHIASNGRVARDKRICIDLITLRGITIRFTMLMNRGKMPLPRLVKKCWFNDHTGCN
jgi:hypothetical protein